MSDSDVPNNESSGYQFHVAGEVKENYRTGYMVISGYWNIWPGMLTTWYISNHPFAPMRDSEPGTRFQHLVQSLVNFQVLKNMAEYARYPVHLSSVISLTAAVIERSIWQNHLKFALYFSMKNWPLLLDWSMDFSEWTLFYCICIKGKKSRFFFQMSTLPELPCWCGQWS